MSSALDPRAGAWLTVPARVGGFVSIRWERRRPGISWIVVTHASPTPAEGFARGDLSVHISCSDEASARAKFNEMRAA